jgi:hypothetical protein
MALQRTSRAFLAGVLRTGKRSDERVRCFFAGNDGRYESFVIGKLIRLNRTEIKAEEAFCEGAEPGRGSMAPHKQKAAESDSAAFR